MPPSSSHGRTRVRLHKRPLYSYLRCSSGNSYANGNCFEGTKLPHVLPSGTHPCGSQYRMPLNRGGIIPNELRVSRPGRTVTVCLIAAHPSTLMAFALDGATIARIISLQTRASLQVQWVRLRTRRAAGSSVHRPTPDGLERPRKQGSAHCSRMETGLGHRIGSLGEGLMPTLRYWPRRAPVLHETLSTWRPAS
jgi:hypothetical protein